MTDRRGFFGAALGGFAAAICLIKSGSEVQFGVWNDGLKEFVVTEGWADSSIGLKKGDIFTISGVYR